MYGRSIPLFHFCLERVYLKELQTALGVEFQPFRWLLNEDAMGADKLSEDIRAFAADAMALEKLIGKQINSKAVIFAKHCVVLKLHTFYFSSQAIVIIKKQGAHGKKQHLLLLHTKRQFCMVVLRNLQLVWNDSVGKCELLPAMAVRRNDSDMDESMTMEYAYVFLMN
uniref:Uncharacterized protein n=1 Tax=Glossina pallidipes TaxID=7398 RepID=A0A1B0A4X5_GLOPL